MFNCNGVIINSLTQAEESLINSLHSTFSIQEEICFNKNKVLFLEEHYFRVIATLRRYRFKIPLNYTIDFFQTELLKLINSQKENSLSGIFKLQFFKSQEGTCFIIKINITKPLKYSSTSYAIDLYKEAIIASGDISNLSATNLGIRIMSKSYAEENGLEDVLLLNDKKNLVESKIGTLYLVQENQILTPSLGSGCQDLVLRNVFNRWIRKSNNDYSLVETELNPFELQKAEEVNIVSLARGFQGVSNYRKTIYSQKRAELIFNNFSDNLIN